MPKPKKYSWTLQDAMDTHKIYKQLLFLEVAYAGALRSVYLNDSIIKCRYLFRDTRNTDKFERFVFAFLPLQGRQPEILRVDYGQLMLAYHYMSASARWAIRQSSNFAPGQTGYSADFLNNLADMIEEKRGAGVARVPR